MFLLGWGQAKMGQGRGVDSYAVVVARLVGQVIVIVVVSIFYEARRILTELVVPILGSVISQ